jgi:MYXO-CTERM domain-containing protein
LALVAASACRSEDEPFTDSSNGATGGNGGSSGTGGTSGTAGEGGAGADPLDDPETIRDWANVASAVAVYASVYEPFAVADGEITFPDPNCPAVTDDGTIVEMVGGCTEESSGKDWVGSATVERSSNGDSRLTLDGFGTPTNTRTGEANRQRVDDTNHDFDVDLVIDSTMAVMTFDYSGHVTGDYDTRTVWSGSGTVTRSGVEAPTGRVEASTTDEVVDDAVCSGQPVSGNTTLQDDAGNTVVITYDGSTDCDEDQAASFSLNGEPQGEITGVVCSYSPGVRKDRSFPLFAVLVVAGAFGVRRRRPSP